MAENKEKTLAVSNKGGEVFIDHQDLQMDQRGVGYICFSPEQAYTLARHLIKHADIAAGGDCCSVCGCTDHTPCSLNFGEPCFWYAKSLCSNPLCTAIAAGFTKAVDHA